MSEVKEEIEMFDFEVTEVQDVSAEEFEAFEKDAEGGNKFFSDPGSYELKVTEIISKGPLAADASWIGIVVKYASITEQVISDFIKVPTCNLLYTTKAGKQSKFMYKLYKDFLTALGVQNVTQENVLTFAPKLFSEGKIVGLSIQGILNYEGAYAKFHSKVDDVTNFVLVHNNEVVTSPETDSEGVHQPLLFPNRDAVEAEAIQRGIQDFQGFISLVGYGDCPNPDQIPSGSVKVKAKAKPRAIGKTAKVKTAKAVGDSGGW